MAAGTNNYFNIDYYWRGSNSVAMIINPAKTQQFGTGISDLNQLLAFIKTTFYLDDIVGFKANYKGVDYHGFWGTVITGGVNEKMHRENRWLEINADTPGQRKHFMNDAGLNTLAFCEWHQRRDIQTNYANYIISPFQGKSAFFVFTDEYGFQHRKVGNANWISQSFGAKNQAVEWHEDLAVTPIEDLYIKDDVIDIRPYIKNAEGVFYGAVKRTILLAKVMNYLAILRKSACDQEGEVNMSVWMRADTHEGILNFKKEEDSSTGFFMYKDPAQTIPVDMGWYFGLAPEDGRRVFFVSQYGEVRRSFICVFVPEIWLNIAGLSDVDGRFLPKLSARMRFSKDVVVSGMISEYNSAGNHVTNKLYSITLLAGTDFAQGEHYNPVYPDNILKIGSAIAVPNTVDSKVLNPVRIF